MSLIGAVALTLGGGIQVAIEDAAVSDLTIAPTDATAEYRIRSDGVVDKTTVSGGTITLEDWIDPVTSAGADYEVQATIVSGSLTSGTVGTWLALNASHTWTLSRTTLGVSTCAMTIEIRHAASGVVLDTANVTLEANKEA